MVLAVIRRLRDRHLSIASVESPAVAEAAPEVEVVAETAPEVVAGTVEKADSEVVPEVPQVAHHPT